MDYRERVRRVKDYVAGNPGQHHSLDELAKLACLSSYHFHRIFSSLAGEPIGRYVQRIRVQRGALELRSNPGLSVTEAALNVGYQTPDGFRRAFQSVFGIAPSKWDRQSPLQERAIAQPGYEFPSYSREELKHVAKERSWQVEQCRISGGPLAVVSIADAYNNIEKVTEAFDQLSAWARRYGADQDKAVLYGISRDDPDISPVERCSFEWALRFKDRRLPDMPAWLNFREEPPLTVAQVHLQGGLEDEDAIWQYLYKVWLPENGAEPAHAPAREIYKTWPTSSGWEQLDLFCAVPITPGG